MFFSKFPHPANFSFASKIQGTEVQCGSRSVQVQVRSFEGGIHHVCCSNEKIWPSNRSLVPITEPKPAETGVTISESGFEFRDESGNVVLSSASSRPLGLNGLMSMFCFTVPHGARFFGMGEKNFDSFERSGKRSLFWNTDVWSDFHFAHWENHEADPSYYSVPYVVMRHEKGYVGILLHTPATSFIETPGRESTRAFAHWQGTAPNLIMGSYEGEPNLWIVTAPSLAELTRKFQKLVGTTPLPPLWALGYHQSRWGYDGEKEIREINDLLVKHKILCDSIWLDIDFMVGYRLFTIDPKHFPNGVKPVTDFVAKHQRRVIPIIDPGVKLDPGYEVYDSGLKKDIFCKNTEGGNYVGIVWPGETVYPDFYRSEARNWWSDYVAKFRESGFGACWVDMNDPSTGPADPSSMLFDAGRSNHDAQRNQYALGMQMATFDGFRKACPNERPFILSRSGSTGSSRYSAIWTGDNLSNDFYLRLSVTTLLGMAISSQPFSCADVGGFGGNATGDLLVRWNQAAFLSPFMRNHSNREADPQEPWAFDEKTLAISKKYIDLRYRFIPYLYQLFAEQEINGDPMMRPMLYDFDDPSMDDVYHQFMVGSALLHAPVLGAKQKSVEVVLPGKQPWFDLAHGESVRPGKKKFKVALDATPLFLRSGGLVSIAQETPTSNQVDLSRPLFLVGNHEKSASGTTRYRSDDGISYDYQKGKRSELEITFTQKSDVVTISVTEAAKGYGDIQPSFAFVSKPEKVEINGKAVKVEHEEIELTGKKFSIWRTV